ncbi:hypothetical protein L1049_024094 [Liquidambar formosana]|uniref:FAR1 domain-containing protein n=1 Tax=Liquidambar formosana TaxID=63359 RepID=A0AAP0RTX7_LIQFO
MVSVGCKVDLPDEDHSPVPTSNSPSKFTNHDNQKIIEEPKLGMEFSSDESAYKFYVSCGKKFGFNVRKHHRTTNAKGFVTRATFCCSKEGYRKKDKWREKVKYRQPVTRVGCEAHMTCLLQKNGKFKIISFNAKHNHELIRTPMKHMLKINRGMSTAQKLHADDAEKSAIPLKATVELMSREVGGREHLGFLAKDYRNYIHE